MMICVRGLMSFTLRVASTPSMPGMTKSIKTTSGTYSRARRTASAPDSASATTEISGCTSRYPLAPLRTISMVIYDHDCDWFWHIKPPPLLDWDSYADFRPSPRLTLEAEIAFERFHPFAHRVKPHPIVLLLDIKTNTIIAELTKT